MQHQVELATARDFLPIAALDRLAWNEDSFIPDGEHTWRIWCEYASVFVVRPPSGDSPNPSDIAAALAMLPTRTGHLFLHKIMVHPAHRGQGMGSALMKAALAQAQAPVLLTVDPENHAAVELYRKYGFTVREHVHGYYRPDEHRYLMIHNPT